MSNRWLARRPRAELAVDMIGQDLMTRKTEIAQSLAGAMPADQWINATRVALAADPQLLLAEPDSLVRSLLVCAQAGVVPATSQTPQSARMMSIIVREVSVNDDGTWRKVKQASPMPEWRLFSQAFAKHPDVMSVTPVLIHQFDHVGVYDDIGQRLEHVVRNSAGEVNGAFFDPERCFYHPESPNCPEDFRNGGLVGGYARIRWTDGRITDHLVPPDHFDKARGASMMGGFETKRGKPTTWGMHFKAMAEKTITRWVAARGIIQFDPYDPLGRRLGAIVGADAVSEGYQDHRTLDIAIEDHSTPPARPVGPEPTQTYAEPEEPAEATQTPFWAEFYRVKPDTDFIEAMFPGLLGKVNGYPEPEDDLTPEQAAEVLAAWNAKSLTP